MRNAGFGWALAGALTLIVGAETSVAQQNRHGTSAAPRRAGAPTGRQENAPAKPAAKPTPPPVEVRTFDLSRAQPDTVRQAVTSCWNQYMQLRGQPASPMAPRLAIDPRTQTLFARGTEKELEAIGELIGLLDAAPGKASSENKNLQVIHLKHAKPNEVLQILNGLGLQNQVMVLPGSNTLLLPRQAQSMDEVQAVIEKVDVEPKQQTKKEDQQTKKVSRTAPGQR